MRERLGKWLQRPELVFLTLATIFGLLSLFLIPFAQVPDENRHFEIEYAMFAKHNIANGTAFSHDVIIDNDGPLAAVRDHHYDDYYTVKIPAKYTGVGITTHGYVDKSDVPVRTFDILHLPQAVGILVGRLIYPSVGVAALTGRLFNLALYVVALFFIIKSIRYGKWVLVMVACLPVMIQQAASLSYDPVNIVAIFTWFTLMVNFFSQSAKPSRKQLGLAGLAIIFLLLTKANNVLLLILLLALPARFVTELKLYQKLRAGQHWRLVSAALVSLSVLVICGGLYVVAKQLLDGHPFHPYKLAHVLLNTFVWGDRGDLTLIDATVTGMVGEFGIFYYHLPIWAVAVAFTVLALVMLHEDLPRVSKRFAAVSGGLFFGSVLVITIGMYYGWAMLPWRLGPNANVADGIQGRYFTPLLILLFPAFAYLQRHLKLVALRARTMPLLVTGTSTFLLLFYIVDTWHFFWR